MGKLFMMTGIPGSGKSTFLKKYHAHDVVVSRDEIRFDLLGPDDEYFSKEKEVYRIFIDKIHKALEDGKSVYVDATHLNYASRIKLLRALWAKKANIEHLGIIYVKVPIETAIMQNELRTGRALVPTSAIFEMADSFEYPTFMDDIDWDEIQIYENGELKIYLDWE